MGSASHGPGDRPGQKCGDGYGHGDGYELGCSHSIHYLYFFLDGELTIEARTEVERHLKHCLSCHQVFDFEAGLRDLVGRRCREAAPPGLQERIIKALRGDLRLGGGILGL